MNQLVMTTEPLLVDSKDAAAILGLSTSEFYSLHCNGRLGPSPVSIKGKELWRVAELRRWVDEGACAPRKKWHEMKGADTSKNMGPFTKMVSKLTDTEENILEALGSDTLRAPVLLKRAGYDNSSHYRQILSNLIKRKILGRNEHGYYIANTDTCQ